MENVKIYKLNEYDGVAALTLEQARDWYLETTRLSEEEAFEYFVPEIYPLTHEVWAGEGETRKVTLRSIVEEYWKGEPFLAFSVEW